MLWLANVHMCCSVNKVEEATMADADVDETLVVAETTNPLVEPPGMYGPEPDLTIPVLSSSVEGEIDDDENMPGYVKAPTWVTTPDKLKGMLWLLVWVIVATTAVVTILAFGTQPYCQEENEATLIRRMAGISWMDKSVDPCTNFYEYVCDTYNKRYTDSSTFSETQYQLFGTLKDKDPATVLRIQEIYEDAVNTTTVNSSTAIPNDAAYALAGVFGGCHQVEVDADYTSPDKIAVYLYNPCFGGCYPQRHRSAPIKIVSLTHLPTTMNAHLLAFLVSTFQTGVPIWWFPPNDVSTSLVAWHDTYCTVNTSVSAGEMWNDIVNGLSPYRTAFTYYAANLEQRSDTAEILKTQKSADMKTVMDRLIASVKELMIDYTAHAATFTKDNAALQKIYRDRITSMQVNYGGGDTIIPTCSLSGVSLYECMVRRWTKQTAMVNANPVINTSAQWPIGALEVNAVFNPVNNQVYIPYAIASPPFFSMDWPIDYQIATLGGVIAHEMGHAIQPGWNFVVTTEGSAEAMTRYENCIIDDYRSSGSVRPVRTLDEDFADAMSLETTIRYFRRQSIEASKTGFIMWSQTWCSAGVPKVYPESVHDPHSATYLRVNSTIKGIQPFYTAFECASPPVAAIC